MSFVDLWERHDFAAIGHAIQSKTSDDVRRALART